MNRILSVKNLRVVFIFVLLLRFLFPFYHNPINALFSDPGRHWNNGLTFVSSPGLFNAIDPKLYQIYIYLLQQISNNGNNHSIIALFTGLLCASFAYFWFRFAKEILPKKHAYILAIIVGLFPTFIGIYAFFMTETIFLNMLGLVLWLSFRAVRKGNLRSASIAVIMLCMFTLTRLTALPIALFLFAVILIDHRSRIRLLFISLAIITPVMLCSGLYSYKIMHVFVPIQFSKASQVNYLSNNKPISYQTQLGRFIFASPSFYTRTSEPLFSYKSSRLTQPYFFNVDLTKGNEDWDSEIKKLKSQLTFGSSLNKKFENAVYLLFAPVWPTSSELATQPLYKRICYHSRWIWFPLILFIILSTPFTKSGHSHSLLIFLTFVMLVLMFVQGMNIFEGRYRLPLEPLILTSVYLSIISYRVGAGTNVIKFNLRYFLFGFLGLFKKTYE